MSTSMSLRDWRVIEKELPPIYRLMTHIRTLESEIKPKLCNLVRIWVKYALGLFEEEMKIRTAHQDVNLAVAGLRFEAACLVREHQIPININKLGEARMKAPEFHIDVQIFTSPMRAVAAEVEESVRDVFLKKLAEAEEDFRKAVAFHLLHRWIVAVKVAAFHSGEQTLRAVCREHGISKPQRQ